MPEVPNIYCTENLNFFTVYQVWLLNTETIASIQNTKINEFVILIKYNLEIKHSGVAVKVSTQNFSIKRSIYINQCIHFSHQPPTGNVFSIAGNNAAGSFSSEFSSFVVQTLSASTDSKCFLIDKLFIFQNSQLELVNAAGILRHLMPM